MNCDILYSIKVTDTSEMTDDEVFLMVTKDELDLLKKLQRKKIIEITSLCERLIPENRNE